ncbi:MAG: hypothetical protein AB7S38_18870 [Vulcanimicrobiota bacterium]
MHSICSRRNRGLTLAEAVFALTLVALVLGLAAGMMREAYRVVRFGETKSRTVQAVQTGLDRMACEVREAHDIQVPVGELRLQKVDPSAPRFTGPPGTWDPTQPGLEVHYRVVNGDLRREAGPSGGPYQSQIIAEGIYGLSCSFTASRNLSIQVAVDERTRIRSFTREVNPPCVP